MSLFVRIRRSAAAAAACVVLVSSSPLAAETRDPSSAQRIAEARRSRLAVKQQGSQTAPLVAQASRRRESSVGMKILGGAIGGVAGFFGGGYLGAAIEGDCNCDDPGLRGALIGAPIGAVVGAIVGVKLASR